MKGQLTIFDTGHKTRPCEYSFQRYIGQKVEFSGYSSHKGEVGEIVDIFPYYTYIKMSNGEVLIGTPHGDFKPYKENQHEQNHNYWTTG